MSLLNRVVFVLVIFLSMFSLLVTVFVGTRDCNNTTSRAFNEDGMSKASSLAASTIPPPVVEPVPKMIEQVKKEEELPKEFRFNLDASSETKKFIEERKKWSSEQWAEESIRLLALNKMPNDWVLIAIANTGMLELSMNFIASVKLNGFEQFLFFCLDFNMYEVLVSHGFKDHAVMVPSGWVGGMSVTDKSVNWGEGQYHNLLHVRWLLLLELLKRNYPFIFSDVDVVFNNPFVIEHTIYQIGRSCLQGGDCYGDFVGLTESQSDFNMGYFAIRPTKLMKDMFQETATLLLEKKFEVDQFAFNFVGRRLNNHYSKEFKRLDKFLYSNGYIFHLRHFNKKWGIKPLLVHINWSEGNIVKKNRLKEQNLWFIGEQFVGNKINT